MRFATEKYSLDPAKISDTRIHVTNFDVNKESVTFQHWLIPEVVFKEKCGVWDPMSEPTKTLPYLIVDNEVQLFSPTTTYVVKWFPNYSKMEQSIGKGRV